MGKPAPAVRIFFSYAHEDEVLRDKLAKHLKLLQRQGAITSWHDRNITAGENWRNEIDVHLESAEIVLLLVSADFLASDYCYEIEMKRSIERHKNNEIKVIPVILRAVDWHSSPFGNLAALPSYGKAITSWQNEDEAFTNVVEGLRKAINPHYMESNLNDKRNNFSYVFGGMGLEVSYLLIAGAIFLGLSVIVYLLILINSKSSVSTAVPVSVPSTAPVIVKGPAASKVYSATKKRSAESAKFDLINVGCLTGEKNETREIENKQLICFTVPGGSNIKKMAQYFDDKEYFSKTDFIDATQNIPRDKFPWLPKDIKNLEGFLFPTTYKIPRKGISAQLVVNKMLKQFEDNVLPLYKLRGAKSDLSFLQLLTLSSIVEKETMVAAERPLIAGVLINRFKKNINLESDYTVEYAFGKSLPLYFSDVRKPHPYNTYTTSGIPPGPISSPGIRSVKAVLDPDTENEMLFYVADNDGTHVFSRTNAEHERATREIRARSN
jgi:hypothetical protein